VFHRPVQRLEGAQTAETADMVKEMLIYLLQIANLARFERMQPAAETGYLRTYGVIQIKEGGLSWP
jgi:hypothetical protein